MKKFILTPKRSYKLNTFVFISFIVIIKNARGKERYCKLADSLKAIKHFETSYLGLRKPYLITKPKTCLS